MSIAASPDSRDVRHGGNRLAGVPIGDSLTPGNLEEAAQALEAMEPIHDSGDSFDRLGDVARRVVDGIGGKT